MRIVESFRPHVTTTQGATITIGDFPSYDEAYDAVILWSSQQLPKEMLKSFNIEKIYRNDAAR